MFNLFVMEVNSISLGKFINKFRKKFLKVKFPNFEFGISILIRFPLLNSNILLTNIFPQLSEF